MRKARAGASGPTFDLTIARTRRSASYGWRPINRAVRMETTMPNRPGPAVDGRRPAALGQVSAHRQDGTSPPLRHRGQRHKHHPHRLVAESVDAAAEEGQQRIEDDQAGAAFGNRLFQGRQIVGQGRQAVGIAAGRAKGQAKTWRRSAPRACRRGRTVSANASSPLTSSEATGSPVPAAHREMRRRD